MNKEQNPPPPLQHPDSLASGAVENAAQEASSPMPPEYVKSDIDLPWRPLEPGESAKIGDRAKPRLSDSPWLTVWVPEQIDSRYEVLTRRPRPAQSIVEHSEPFGPRPAHCHGEPHELRDCPSTWAKQKLIDLVKSLRAQLAAKDSAPAVPKPESDEWFDALGAEIEKHPIASAPAAPPEYPPHHAGILCLKCKTMHSPHEAHECKWSGLECGWLDKDDGEFATSCGKSLCYDEHPSFKDYPYCAGCGRRVEVKATTLEAGEGAGGGDPEAAAKAWEGVDPDKWLEEVRGSGGGDVRPMIFDPEHYPEDAATLDGAGDQQTGQTAREWVQAFLDTDMPPKERDAYNANYVALRPLIKRYVWKLEELADRADRAEAELRGADDEAKRWKASAIRAEAAFNAEVLAHRGTCDRCANLEAERDAEKARADQAEKDGQLLKEQWNYLLKDRDQQSVERDTLLLENGALRATIEARTAERDALREALEAMLHLCEHDLGMDESSPYVEQARAALNQTNTEK